MSTRREIIRSTQALLLERGHAGTTIAALKRHAGIGSGTLYHHFPLGGRRIDAAKVAAGTVPSDPLEQIVGLALSELVERRVERLAEVLYDEPDDDQPHDDQPPQHRLLARLATELDHECPLVRLCSDPGLVGHARHRRVLSDGVDTLVDALARHPDGPGHAQVGGTSGSVTSGSVTSGSVTSGSVTSGSGDPTPQSMVLSLAVVAFLLGFTTLERLYRIAPKPVPADNSPDISPDKAPGDEAEDDDPRSPEERDADIDVLLRPGGYRALQRRRRTMSALADLRDAIRSAQGGEGLLDALL